MQTFLPYQDFKESAKVLDYRRLGKQRVEAYQLLLGQWPNHPASKMWRGYEKALATYGLVICEEWVSRGYRDTMRQKFQEWLDKNSSKELILPAWIGGPIHATHRSKLLSKNYEYYSKFNWTEQPGMDYIWPPGKDL